MGAFPILSAYFFPDGFSPFLIARSAKFSLTASLSFQLFSLVLFPTSEKIFCKVYLVNTVPVNKC